MKHPLVEFIEGICRDECHGLCCREFPVWYMDAEMNLKRHRVYKKTKNCVYLTGHNLKLGKECWFWREGGCNGKQKAKYCKEYICAMLEDMLYLPVPDEERHFYYNATLAGTRIYNNLKKYK